MNYNHHYHAGNFADVFKHLTLIFCLERLCEKETAFFALDTHYDLQDEPAIKTSEALDGILKFLQTQNLSNSLLANYLKILSKINNCELKFFKNNPKKIRFYPGSPYIIKHFLRPQDRTIFAEIKKEEFLLLKKNMAGNKKINFLNQDGFLLAKSVLPPPERRGIILIDPAFEKNSNLTSQDYEKTIDFLKEAQKRFAHAIYLVWHPIINKENEEKTLQKFYQDIKDLKFKEIMHIIFQNDENNALKMNSCGLFVINPVFAMDKKLREVFGDKINIK